MAPPNLSYKGKSFVYTELKEEVTAMPKLKVTDICYGCKKAMCEICAECETSGCQLMGRSITSRYSMMMAGLALPASQKAKGFQLLTSRFGLQTSGRGLIITEEADLAFVTSGTTQFVRPCPIRPRHGFVESRAMELTTEGLKAIWDESRAADPQAELLICPLIKDAAMSAIITPSMLAVGPGNDGATGGKESVSIPLMGVLPPEIANKQYLTEAGIDYINKEPYLELVRNQQNSWFYTQIREGTKAPKAPDFVPERMRVAEVLEASGDLIEWEAQAKQIKQGTVVVHLGGTLISHYGVHCTTNRVPMLTTRIPRIGEVLEPVGEVVEYEPAAVIKGLALGVMIPLLTGDRPSKDGAVYISAALPLMMTILHNAGAMGNGYGIWLGFATSIMLRAGMAASHGEARHADQAIKSLYTRNQIYSTALKDFFGSRSTLGMAQFAFRNHKWSGSYGGVKWADCTESILKLDRAARELIKDPANMNRVELINALNVAVNQAHNGGWWLNKFVEQYTFEEASTQSLKALERAAVALLPVHNFFQSVQEEGWKAIVEQWGALGEIEIKGRVVESTEIEESDDFDEDPPLELEEPDVVEDTNEVTITPIADLLKAQAPQSGPKNPPVGHKGSTGIYKVPFDPKAVIAKAHVRIETYTSTQLCGHLQCLLKGGMGYWSYDIVLSPGMSAEVKNKIHLLPKESSYSSDAKGYIALGVGEDSAGWIFSEPSAHLSLFLSKANQLSASTESIPYGT